MVILFIKPTKIFVEALFLKPALFLCRGLIHQTHLFFIKFYSINPQIIRIKSKPLFSSDLFFLYARSRE